MRLLTLQSGEVVGDASVYYLNPDSVAFLQEVVGERVMPSRWFVSRNVHEGSLRENSSGHGLGLRRQNERHATHDMTYEQSSRSIA